MLLKIASHYKDLTLKVEAKNGKMTEHDQDLIKKHFDRLVHIQIYCNVF